MDQSKNTSIGNQVSVLDRGGRLVLLPLIGYFVASGSIAPMPRPRSTIEGADKEVQKYASGKLPNCAGTSDGQGTAHDFRR